jgi:hypothetical protein
MLAAEHRGIGIVDLSIRKPTRDSQRANIAGNVKGTVGDD